MEEAEEEEEGPEAVAEEEEPEDTTATAGEEEVPGATEEEEEPEDAVRVAAAAAAAAAAAEEEEEEEEEKHAATAKDEPAAEGAFPERFSENRWCLLALALSSDGAFFLCEKRVGVYDGLSFLSLFFPPTKCSEQRTSLALARQSVLSGFTLLTATSHFFRRSRSLGNW